MNLVTDRVSLIIVTPTTTVYLTSSRETGIPGMHRSSGVGCILNPVRES